MYGEDYRSLEVLTDQWWFGASVDGDTAELLWIVGFKAGSHW